MPIFDALGEGPDIGCGVVVAGDAAGELPGVAEHRDADAQAGGDRHVRNDLDAPAAQGVERLPRPGTFVVTVVTLRWGTCQVSRRPDATGRSSRSRSATRSTGTPAGAAVPGAPTGRNLASRSRALGTGLPSGTSASRHAAP